MSAPKIKEVLEDAEESLKNAELIGIPGMVFNPVCDGILVPVTEKATEIVPAIAGKVPLPFVDDVSALALGICFGAMKVGYSVLPHVDEDTSRETHGILTDELKQVKAYADKHRTPKPILSSLMGVLGFSANAVIDLARLPFSGDLGEWIETSKQFLGYLMFSGVGQELMEGFLSVGVVDAMMIMGRAQEERNNSSESRRIRTAMTSIPKTVVDKSGFQKIILDAARYGKYASAAYGLSMIASSELLQVFGQKVEVPIVKSTSETKRVRKMAEYLGVKPEDIIDPTSPGGDIDLLGHFVAVDRRPTQTSPENKPAVVLALRGTYTISGVKSDAECFSAPFCNGIAHSGIAERTVKLWDYVEKKVVKYLKANPGFDLVITGHSLGAGAAALLALKLKAEGTLAKADPALADVDIRCFAFAPPPVYLCENEKKAMMDEVMKNTYAFIHENDCVPFCSTDTIRRLARAVDNVDAATNVIEGPLMAIGAKGITEEIKDMVFDESELPFAPNAEKLAIPAPYTIWMRKVDEDEHGRPLYNAMFCRPLGGTGTTDTNDLNILVDKRMISDHMNPQYERAIGSIAAQMTGTDGIDGYVFPPTTN